MSENPLREVRVEKVTVNIGIGEAGEKVERAKKLLETLTGKKVIRTRTKKRTTFGTPKGREIGVKITLRKKEALNFLIRLLKAVDNKIKSSSFGDGNFSFGIEEYIDIPDAKYDPNIGIFGMDVCVTLERPGYRVKRRKISKKIGKSHQILKEETMKFAQEKLGVEIA